MNTTIEALQNLYTALGGTASEVADLVTIPDMINAIAQLGAIQASASLSTDEDNNIIITSPNDIYLEAYNGQIRITSSDSVSITSESNEVNIKAEDTINIESEENGVKIKGHDDVDIISTHSAIAIDAQGANVELTGDAVRANGKEVATVD